MHPRTNVRQAPSPRQTGFGWKPFVVRGNQQLAQQSSSRLQSYVWIKGIEDLRLSLLLLASSACQKCESRVVPLAVTNVYELNYTT